MTHGPPIELLFYALRGGETFGIGVHGPRFWASLVLKGRRVHHAEGIPGLLGPLEAELPNPARLQGHRRRLSSTPSSCAPYASCAPT